MWDREREREAKREQEREREGESKSQRVRIRVAKTRGTKAEYSTANNMHPQVANQSCLIMVALLTPPSALSHSLLLPLSISCTPFFPLEESLQLVQSSNWSWTQSELLTRTFNSRAHLVWNFKQIKWQKLQRCQWLPYSTLSTATLRFTRSALVCHRLRGFRVYYLRAKELARQPWDLMVFSGSA